MAGCRPAWEAAEFTTWLGKAEPFETSAAISWENGAAWGLHIAHVISFLDLDSSSPSSRHLPSSPPLYGSPLHWCKPLGCRAPLPPLTAPAAPQHPATRPCGPLVRMSRRSHGEGSRRKRTSWACQGASNGQESQC